MRIVSFLPAATEMACQLGLAHHLVGVSHECDYPEAARGKPKVIRTVLPVDTMTPGQIDAAVTERIRAGGSLYEVDLPLLRELAPTHILTQDLCNVCAPARSEIAQAIELLPSKPQVLWFSPQCLGDIIRNVLALGEATGRLTSAQRLAATMLSRLGKLAELTRRSAARPRVFCLEWTEPYYCAGHWVPEMVQIAGGFDALGQEQRNSTVVDWNQIERWAPEILVVMPCGFGLDGAVNQARQVIAQSRWKNVPAIQHGRVFAVDANSFFARPGPRVVEGTELLAHLIHPDRCEWNGPANAFRAICSQTVTVESPAAAANLAH